MNTYEIGYRLQVGVRVIEDAVTVENTGMSVTAAQQYAAYHVGEEHFLSPTRYDVGDLEVGWEKP